MVFRDHSGADQRGYPVTRQSASWCQKNGITSEHDGALKVSVTHAAEKRKANTALARVIALEPGLNNSQLDLNSDTRLTHKSFVVTGLEFTKLNNRSQAPLKS